MRILRRRSNLEVSAKGFALFVAGLVVATFVGGALRTILSSDRVHQRIVRELKNRFPKNDVDVQSIEVLLSRGIWPALGLRVHDLTLRQDLCGKLSFDLRVPEAVLPVSLWALRRGEVRLGRVDIPGGRLDLDYHPCVKPGEDEPRPAPSLRDTVRARGIQPPTLDADRLGQALDGVDLTQVEVTFRRAPQWKLRVVDARVRFGEKLTLDASLDLQRALPFGAVSHPIEVTATSVGAEIEGRLTSELKEGRLRLDGRWDLRENAARVTAQATQVPLKELATELYQTGLTREEYKFKSAWLTAAAEWAGPLAEPFATPLVITAARVEGGYGRLTLEHAEIFPERQPPLGPGTELRATRVQIAALADALGVKLAPTVIARPGFWTGTIRGRGPREWDATGRLENVEISFSNQSVRGKQIIEGVAVEVKRAGDRVDALLDNFGLQGGAVRGALTAAWDLPRDEATFEADFEGLSFHPSVQAVLTGGQIALLGLDTRGTLRGGRWAQWTARVTAPTVTGDGWVAEDAAVEANFQPAGRMIQLVAKAPRISVERRWRHFAALESAWPTPLDQFRWQDVATKLLVREDGGVIQSLRAAGGGVPWVLSGGWQRDGEANAMLKVGGARAQKSYRLRGERGAITVEAE